LESNKSNDHSRTSKERRRRTTDKEISGLISTQPNSISLLIRSLIHFKTNMESNVMNWMIVVSFMHFNKPSYSLKIFWTRWGSGSITGCFIDQRSER
jgi:hypothetical protein